MDIIDNIVTDEATIEKTVDQETDSVPKKRGRKSSANIKENNTETSKKIFKKDDMILCKSIMTGKTFVKGLKTGTSYRFEYQGAIEEIEYQDLITAVKTKANCLFKPTIIVLDDEFIEQNKVLSEFYTKFYAKDFNKIFEMSPSQLERTLKELPVGAQNAIKSMAATKIANGSFDSVQRIKVFDKVFNTKMMLLTGLYNDQV